MVVHSFRVGWVQGHDSSLLNTSTSRSITHDPRAAIMQKPSTSITGREFVGLLRLLASQALCCMALSTTRIFQSTKVTVIRQRSMKAHCGNGDIEPSFLNSGNRSSLPGHFSPKEIAAGINWTEGSVGHDHVRAPKIISCSCRKSNQDSSIYQPLAKSL